MVPAGASRNKLLGLWASRFGPKKCGQNGQLIILARTSRKRTSRLPNKPVGPVSVGGRPAVLGVEIGRGVLRGFGPASPTAQKKQLACLIGRVSRDDVLVVTRLDQLARSTRDLLNLLGAIAIQRGWCHGKRVLSAA